MLKYDIAHERLYGPVGKRAFNLHAVSGGGRGSKLFPRGRPGERHLGSWNFRRKTRTGVRGGPIPPGLYIVHRPAVLLGLGLCSLLEQTLTSLIHADFIALSGFSATDRSGFLIHGRGPRGSDGCIVPMEQFQQLMNAITQAAPLLLQVKNPGRLLLDDSENAVLSDEIALG